jgi:chromatin assembly factor 1 subunit A
MPSLQFVSDTAAAAVPVTQPAAVPQDSKKAPSVSSRKPTKISPATLKKTKTTATKTLQTNQRKLTSFFEKPKQAGIVAPKVQVIDIIVELDPARKAALRDICLGRRQSSSSTTFPATVPTEPTEDHMALESDEMFQKDSAEKEMDAELLNSAHVEVLTKKRSAPLVATPQRVEKPAKVMKLVVPGTTHLDVEVQTADVSAPKETLLVDTKTTDLSDEKETLHVKTDTIDLTDEKSIAQETSSMDTNQHQVVRGKLSSMRGQFNRRLTELWQQCHEPEERLAVALPTNKEQGLLPTQFESFPDCAISTLAALIEGNRDSLSELAASLVTTLNSMYETNAFTPDMIVSKLKLLAARKPYRKQTLVGVDVFENKSAEHMWRWEVSALDLFATKQKDVAKKARAARSRLARHIGAVEQLLHVLQESSSAGEPTQLLASVSQEEEKVLKFEREEEKARLVREAKAQSEQAKAAELEKKAQAKKELAEKKQLEQEQKKKDIAEKKKHDREQAKRALAEAKKADALAKEELEKKELAKKEALRKKQSGLMMSMFSKPKAAQKPALKAKEKSPAKPCAKPTLTNSMDVPSNFDTEKFWTSVGCDANLSTFSFRKRSKTARRNGRRRTEMASVQVTVTVAPDDENPFSPDQPYAEEREIQVYNKYKYFLFNEDVRPPYYGTWSKKSDIVSGRKPFAQDSSHVDYEYDSEAEWEEGDNEVGEDVDNDGDDDEKDEEPGEDDDGFIAAEDEIDDELDLDVETKLLKQKQRETMLANASSQRPELQTIRIISPFNGMPFNKSSTEPGGYVEGFTFSEGCDLLASHSVISLDSDVIFLDAFAPTMIDEVDGLPLDATNKEMSDEDVKTFLRFVHGCTLGSKDKIVEELIAKHNSLTSQSNAYRLLSTMAEKKKHAIGGGVTWVIKAEFLAKYGLEDLAQSAEVDTVLASQEAIKAIAKFVHHSNYTSKEKAVDALLNGTEVFTASRAETMRVFESIAEKKKHPINGGGVYWEVKQSVRENLGLELPNEPPSPNKSSDDSTPAKAPEVSSTDAMGLIKSSPTQVDDAVTGGPIEETESLVSSASRKCPLVAKNQRSVLETLSTPAATLADTAGITKTETDKKRKLANLLAQFLKEKKQKS